MTDYGTTTVPFTIENPDLNFKLNGQYVVGTGVDDYNELSGKPRINDIELKGNKTSDDLGLQQKLIEGENVTLLDNGDGTTTISAIGGGSSELTSDLIVSNPIGKYTMDEVITEGTALETIFRGILSKTYYPTLTNPSCSITYSVPSLLKVGTSVTSRALSIVFNRGSINPQYTSESQYRSGVATQYNTSLSGASIEFSQSNTSGYFTIPEFTRNTKGNVVVNASVSYEAGVQPKDSDGNNYQTPLPSGSVSSNKTIEFILPFYYGVSVNKVISSLTGLTEDLSKKGQKTYAFTSNNEYLVVAYDSS